MKKQLTLLSIFTVVCLTPLLAQTDYTSSITNPSFETGNSNGWTWTGAAGYAWLGPNTDGDATKNGNYINGLWNGSLGDVEFSQTVTGLPEGYYRLTALVTVSTNRLTNQRIFAEFAGETVSMLYGAENHAAHSVGNLTILSESENYSFGGYRESSVENGPFYRLKVFQQISGGDIKIGIRVSGKSSSKGFDFSHTTSGDAGFFKFDHFTLTEVSNLATVDLITLSKGALNSPFDPEIFTYSATIPAGSTDVTPFVIPSVNGMAITGTDQVDLSSGSGSSTIEVQAIDGSTSNTYTINYTVSDPVVIVGEHDNFYSNEFLLSDVALLDGPFKHARDVNVQTLLQYDTDRLLEPFVTEAGLETEATRFPNWENLAGSIGGHYLSAVAMSYAATGNSELKNRMDYMLTTLKACQDANGDGYLGGIPNGKTMWNQLKAGTIQANEFTLNGSWVPWYNIHKIYAGLRDAWYFGESELAAEMFLDLCDWGIDIVSGLTVNQRQNMLVAEFGGMNEVYADAYFLTNEAKYLEAAKWFTHNSIYTPLTQGIDDLDNKHANTQIPKVVGFSRIADLDKEDAKYLEAATFFWKTVVENRTLALGGNSRREYFPQASGSMDYITEVEGPESCNTHNMLKLTEHLFRMDPQVKYVDYYERALYNHILSTIHPEHGGYVYFTPARPQHYRVYSAPNQAMWCCVGSGMENPGKYGEFIYSNMDNALYLNLFMASELNWEEKGVTIRQETAFPYEEKTRLYISTSAPADFKLMIRSPEWVAEGKLKVVVNKDTLQMNSVPGSYIPIDRTWSNTDSVHVILPMHTRIEALPNVPSYVAIMHGPVLLGTKTGTQDLEGLIADDSRWGHIAHGSLQALNEAPIFVGDREEIASKVLPIENQALRFNASQLLPDNSDAELILEPFFSIHDARYMMYWLAINQDEYQEVLDSLEAVEKAALELDARTIDAVATGEQQPEVDHDMQIQNSFTGSWNNEFWRDARDGGFISYHLRTGGKTELTLMVRYWGNETGSRAFDIFLDDEKVASENVVGKWNVNEFVNIEYPIPNSMVEGKESVTVKFQAINNTNIAGGLFHVRMLGPVVSTGITDRSKVKPDWNLYVKGKDLIVEGLPANAHIKVFDIRGSMEAQKAAIQNSLTVQNLSSGIKIVQVQVNGIPYTYKIIIH